MDDSRQTVRDFLREALADAGDRHGFGDEAGLFTSGRLDSLAMTRLVLFLEERFGFEFGAGDFDIERIDSVDAIALLLESEGARRA